MRTGFGFDVHALVDGRPLILAGVRVPYERGLEGFSDADVASHAIIDALLGAAGLGDCGTHFPAGDPQFAGADSAQLLQQSVVMLAQAGYRVNNIDCTIVADAPALGGHITRMRSKLAAVIAIEVGSISVKAKRTEGLGFTGEGRGMAAFAVATIEALDSSP